MAIPDFVYIGDTSGVGSTEVEVQASDNLGGTRGGSIHVKTTSGLSKEVLISQNAAQQIRYKPDAGTKFFIQNDLNVAMSVDDYLIFQIVLTENSDVNNPGESIVLDLFSFYGGLRVGQSAQWNSASPRSYFPKFKYLYGYGLAFSGVSPLWKDFKLWTNSGGSAYIAMGTDTSQRPLSVVDVSKPLYQIMNREISVSNCERFSVIRAIPENLTDITVTIRDSGGGNVVVKYIEA